MSPTDEQDDNRWRNRLLASPLWLLALLPILPPLFLFAYASWEPGCVNSDAAADGFRIGTGATVAAQLVGLVLLARWMRDRPGRGGLLAILLTIGVGFVGLALSFGIADAAVDTGC